MIIANIYDTTHRYQGDWFTERAPFETEQELRDYAQSWANDRKASIQVVIIDGDLDDFWAYPES
jgi:hypothetical protein